MKTSKICLVILCLLPVLAVGLPQSHGAISFMKEIQLTRNQVAIVDDDIFEYLNQWKWRAMPARKQHYAARVIYPSKQNLLMHRFIMDVIDKPDIFVDHRDRNPLNNQKSNLRLCNRKQNTYNQAPKPGCTSKYKGVCLYKGKWRSSMKHDGITINIGDFESEIDAALAYNAKALELQGEFAYLNQVS